MTREPAENRPQLGRSAERRSRPPSGCCGRTGWRASAGGTALRYAYTRPSPGRYPWQWYWDSCFAAIVWRRFDPARARAELESLLAAQRPNGFVGHTIFWDRPVSLIRLPFYNVASRGAFQTETIQPPLLAWAWRIAVGDPADGAADRRPHGLAGGQPRPRGRRAALDRAARRVRARRLAEVRAGLGPAARTAARLPAAGPAQPPARLRRPAGPRCAAGRCSARTLVNTMWSLSLQAMGRPSATPALVERLWDERRGALPRRGASPAARGRRSVTWASLAPLALPDLPEAIGRRLVEEHLLEPRRVPDPGRAALGRGLGAELRARRRPRPDPPLLARADLGQLRLDGLAGHAPPRLRRGGAASWPTG